MIAIEGMAGVGKTTLANFAAHILSLDFSDAQLFIELGASGATPLTARQALTQCLYALYPDAQKLPDDLVVLRNLYLSAIQGKRALVILDDVRDDEQVELLLPPEGCVTMVTSRRRLTSGQPFSLDILLRRDAARMLQRICPRISDSEASVLAVLCNDLPVALQVAAGHLKVNVAKPILEYINSLQSSRRFQLFEKVNALFETSYRALKLEQQAALHALSIMPADFNRQAGIAVIGQGDVSAEALDDLLALNFLQFNEKTQRFSWQNLLREFVQSYTIVEENHAARIRHLEYFTKVAQEIGDLYEQGNENVLTSLQLMDTELVHIRAAIQFANEGESEAEKPYQSAFMIVLIEALTDVGPLRFHPREWVQWLTTQIEAAHKVDQPLAQSRGLASLGFAYVESGEVQRAIKCYKQGLKIARKLRDRKTEGLILGRLGFAYVALGDIPRAIDYHEKQLKVVRKIGDLHDEGTAVNGLGIAYFKQGEIKKAIDYYQQSLQIRRTLGDRRGEAIVLVNLGAAYVALGQIQWAFEQYEMALQIQKQIGDRLGEANVTGNLGNIHVERSEIPGALACYKRQLELAHEIGNPWNESSALGNLGLVYFKSGEFQQAIEHYQQQLTIAQRIGDHAGTAISCFNLSLAYKKLSDIQLAQEYANRALEIFQAIRSPEVTDAQNWLEQLRQL